MSHIWTLGINHESAAVDLRARFVVQDSELEQQLQALQESIFGLDEPGEVALVCTCNRTEIYGASTGEPAAQAHIAQAHTWLASLGGIAPERLADHLYIKRGEHACAHALRVASGLESMVLGETQILGQMKDALRAAQFAGTAGSNLNRLFQKAFSVAKAVRTHTAIGTQTVSLAAAATKLCADVFEDWAHTAVLMIGAGEMIELCAAHFAAKRPAVFAIANRALERGIRLARRFGTESLNIEAMGLGEIATRLWQFDVVLSCTASTLPIVGLGMVQAAIKTRKHRPMVMIDLAVPRDIEPQVAALPDVYLYTIDDLGAVVQTGNALRTQAASEARQLIEQGVTSVMSRIQESSLSNKIQSLMDQSLEWQTEEIAKAKSRMQLNANESPAITLEQLDAALRGVARGLSAKFLHQAITHMKKEP